MEATQNSASPPELKEILNCMRRIEQKIDQNKAQILQMHKQFNDHALQQSITSQQLHQILTCLFCECLQDDEEDPSGTPEDQNTEDEEGQHVEIHKVAELFRPHEAPPMERTTQQPNKPN
ncbi:hypothetical protein F53441_2331 [Fusarium austroafricanum]|uniref:Uncharacterized protein n=1 Tax=Fusarium austroafricanum TaxID=2364996 RepID=A0A8H4KQC2_9HYPO|nr:hypothetical protein F53441_2331 [Fusarium austroafricanum]